MQNITGNARHFGIKLANNEIWQFISTSETEEWLEKLRIIMGLGKITEIEGRKIIFLKNINDEEIFSLEIFNEEISNQKNVNEGTSIERALSEKISNEGILSEWNITTGDLNGINLLSTGPLRIYVCPNTSNLICDIGNPEFPEVEIFKMAQSVLPIYMRALSLGGIPLHAALIERDGKGIAIAAPGGTGKSTCARRIPHPWQALCDDELLIVSDKKCVYQAHPFPTWSRCKVQKPEETWNVQTHVPLSTIFFLKKSQKDEVNSLSFSQSAQLIYKLSLPVFDRVLESVDQEQYTAIKKLIFENACDLARKIPAFILEAKLEGKFWEAIDRALSIDPQEDCVNAGVVPGTY